ncbi:Retrovirus-related Pol polyprotein from transposon TNT 1-94 [Sesamum angolense]|uniref:Retrovirus-related Pol polyprotein from transposon TNT 1-94 n=1 Tax=Sesamum angolense TaxID=2727404 RepID=A0AAE1W6U6_9LAMI|nr:Retrovirus-related Pol polyprotein from transposon TNT 1-94 [Sesamum angolense]
MPCAALEEEGLEGRWGKGIMKIMKGSLTVFKADRRRNLYVCSVNYDILAASVTDFDKTSLWHKRLGHISQKGLELLQKEGVLSDKIEKLKFCDECVMGKQHKVQFPASQNPNPLSSSCILDYVHADVWGPSNIPTHGGNKKWKILVENQTGKKLKVLRTDNGLEFCNQSFSNLYDECGIKRHKTNPYTLNKMGEENDEELGTEFPENTNSGGLDDYLLARDRNRREPRIPARPDIAYFISCLSRYMSNAGSPHWEALKWLLRYLNGSANRGLMFSKCAKGVDLTGYVDSNYANDRDSRRSTTSYIFTLCGSCITWKSQLQQIVALSTTEAEYIAATEAFKEALWLEGIVKEIGFLKQKITNFSDRTPLKNGDDDKP